MSLKVAALGLMFCALLIGAALYSKANRPSKVGVGAALPTATSQQEASSSVDNDEEPSPEALTDTPEPQELVLSIEEAARSENDAQLERFFELHNLPATTKAKLISMALTRQDDRLIDKAEELLRAMLQEGTTADVLAAIPKAAHFSQKTLSDVARMQSSLCRFQSPASSRDQLGFEMIKMKFNLVLGKEPGVRPWRTVCPSS